MIRELVPVLAIATFLFACNQGISDHISCHEDDHCPSDYFCSRVGYCVDLEKAGPPDIQVVGVSSTKEGEPTPSIHVGREASSLYLVLRNAGREQGDPSVLLEGPSCLHISGKLASNAFLQIDPGETARRSIFFSADEDCATPATVNVTMTVGGGSVSPLRVTHGSFSIALQ